MIVAVIRSRYFSIAGGLLALLVVAAQPVHAGLTEDLFQKLLQSPDDPDLNIAYARAAEAEGSLRHALAAYERVARAHPDHPTAWRDFERMRARLAPRRTSVVASLGSSYHENVRQLPHSLNGPNDTTIDGTISVFDERSAGDVRWRTLVEGAYRFHTNESDLSEVAVGAWTGPVVPISPTSDLHVAFGGVFDWLDGDRYYNDLSARLSYQFIRDGTLNSVNAYVAHREVQREGSRFDDGLFLQIDARLRRSDVMAPGDSFYVVPRIQYSDASGGDGDGVIYNGTHFVADYISYGGRIAYYYPVVAGRFFAGAGISVYQRDFDLNVAFGTQDRRDLYVEPTAHMIFMNALGQSRDIRLDYRYEHNDSNDAFEDFETHVVGMRFVGRF